MIWRTVPSENGTRSQSTVCFYQVPIHRLGKLESVYVVAFALSQLDESGAMAERECNQFELCHVLQPLAR
jgi:hypothetical protein